MKFLILALAILLMPASAFAHAGDHLHETLEHYLSSPFHLLPAIIILGVVVYFLVKKIKSKKVRSK